MKSPTVSVVMATYNHADFVLQSIESVLSQRGVDFEFLIIDDGSSDRTKEIVSTVHDERIHFFPNAVNRGACVVTNELINRASGEFIALINSDDYWIGNDKLTYQIELMKENPSLGASFGRAVFVDKDGRTIEKSMLPFGCVFDQPNRSRGAWLRYFFDCGNCICHPTMLIRKSCYETLGMYDNRLRQLPDFDMWVRLTKSYDIHISDKEMVAFRHLPGENASSDTPVNIRRILNESYLILKRFFDKISHEVFHDGFGDLMVKRNFNDNVHMDIEQSLLYLTNNRWASHIYNLIGLEKVHFLLGSDRHRTILIEQYGIDDHAFHSMAAAISSFDLSDVSGRLSTVRGSTLLGELKSRAILRAPAVLRPLLNTFFNWF